MADDDLEDAVSQEFLRYALEVDHPVLTTLSGDGRWRAECLGCGWRTEAPASEDMTDAAVRVHLDTAEPRHRAAG